MCGITGLLSNQIFSTEQLSKMADVMFRRGPDSSGTWHDIDTDIGLAHRRLAIVDLSPAGHQPMQQFMQWYNHGHQHSKIRFVTPAQRHHGEDKAILAKRVEVYAAAKAEHPELWSGDTRNWTHIAVVTLNPDKPAREK